MSKLINNLDLVKYGVSKEDEKHGDKLSVLQWSPDTCTMPSRTENCTTIIKD